MRVLVVSNSGTTACGIAEVGRQMARGLQSAGADVTVWDGSYEAIYARQQRQIAPFFPPDVEAYDVVVVNWHPLSLNHYTGAQAWPSRPLRVGILHEQTDSYCPFRAAFDRIEAPEQKTDEHAFDYPCVAYESPVRPDPPVVLGVSSLRGDGYGPVADLCARRGWTLNAPTPGVWLPIEAEIDRLARSTVTVAWYHADQGKASGVMTLVAARRPVVVSDSSMFSQVRGWTGIYTGPSLVEAVARALVGVPPHTLAETRTWPALAARWLAEWADTPRRRP